MFKSRKVHIPSNKVEILAQSSLASWTSPPAANSRFCPITHLSSLSSLIPNNSAVPAGFNDQRISTLPALSTEPSSRNSSTCQHTPRSLFTGVITLAMMLILGCNPSPSSSSVASEDKQTPATESSTVGNLDEDHPHIPGAHGGIIIPIGADSYHAEAVIEKDGTMRLFMLGADETRIHEVDQQAAKAFVKVTGETDAIPVELTATPQDGDSPGKTSQFTARLPEAAIGQAIDVTIPNLRIGAERFRVGFTTAIQNHDSGMPAAVTGDAEQELYFTAAGKYTEADIKANGKLSAGAKFKGFMSKHDMNPQPGDLICPVTFTKANPTVAWQINGKKYIFCCPPCVDEFVRMAKEEPEKILEPEAYVKPDRSGDQPKQDKQSNDGSAVQIDSTATEEITAALAALSGEDRQLATAQKFCAVATNSALGSMGTPIKIDIDGTPVYLCCEGCRKKALREPEATLAAAGKLKQQHGNRE